VRRLAGHAPANGILLRGISSRPNVLPFTERFGLRAAAIASYPMYRGLAQLVGMDKIPTGDTPGSEFADYVRIKKDYDFAFIHIKGTDMAGEDGDFDAKVRAIEGVDSALPALLDAAPGVLAITGDHATPVSYRAHGWQPVPVLVHGARSGCDRLERFTERSALLGSLGTVPSHALMPILLATAGRLGKYGA
jgi:2,3-bisphosphoglycerate-independent phosphoglycerate mutase